MAPRNSGALVVGYRKEDERRFVRDMPAGFDPGSRLFLPARRIDLGEFRCEIDAGTCISCGARVFLNHWGYSAVLEKDADVVCFDCEDRYSADITRGL